MLQEEEEEEEEEEKEEPKPKKAAKPAAKKEKAGASYSTAAPRAPASQPRAHPPATLSLPKHALQAGLPALAPVGPRPPSASSALVLVLVFGHIFLVAQRVALLGTYAIIHVNSHSTLWRPMCPGGFQR